MLSPIDSNTCNTYSILYAVTTAAWSFAYVIDSATVFCIELLHPTGAPFNMTRPPDTILQTIGSFT